MTRMTACTPITAGMTMGMPIGMPRMRIRRPTLPTSTTIRSAALRRDGRRACETPLRRGPGTPGSTIPMRCTAPPTDLRPDPNLASR